MAELFETNVTSTIRVGHYHKCYTADIIFLCQDLKCDKFYDCLYPNCEERYGDKECTIN